MAEILPMADHTELTLCENNLNGGGAHMSERCPVLRFLHKTVPLPASRLPTLEVNW